MTITGPLPAQPLRWESASRRGPRAINADATAAHVDPHTGRTAFAVADGIGDTESAARAARLAARIAATAAAETGDPRDAVLAAQRAVCDATSGSTDGDAVLAVVVPGLGPAGRCCAVAWVGDCRVYHWNGRVLAQLTTDHTVAEYFRSRGQAATPRMEHMVTTSVRTVPADRIGSVHTSVGTGRLVLCTDGVHKTLPVGELRDILDRPAPPDAVATFLVDNALRFGTRDNSTALVVEHPRPAPDQVAA